ncbi:alpha/beta hydrolase [Spirosoma taeanense]|uniref:Alpha/beta hydrolase n=1 Tax=Spirosoma taeanense TaxID=2735870 RepID=A0A6M5YB53_9BACT|nr:alpha/beta hydrolase [Spirosoma taeanense]QJW90764.1 alpha/beta hydrolase [Spirosoma taeanense]
MKSSVFSLFACLLAVKSLAQISPTIPPKPYTYADFPESKASSTTMKVVSIDRDSSLVTYRPNVKYITRDGLDLTLQIIEPTFAKGKRPCIVYVQGSAWMKQNVYANLPQLAEFARRGYVIAVVEYRPSSVASFPAQLQDTKTAIRFMREQAATYHVDVNNVFIWGDSSGGHTALMVGLTQNNPELDTKELGNYPITVNAVVDFYGPTDITQMNLEPSIFDHIGPKSPEGQLLGGKNVLENKELAAATNPINYIKSAKNGAPILLIHGSKDRLVPFQQSVLLADALEKNNYRYQFYQLKGADHGSPEFWSRKTFDLVEAFLKQYTVKN